MPYPCPCCNFLTLVEKPPGTFNVCPVCFWRDDHVQSADIKYRYGANDVSLVDARRNFVRYGAIKKELAQYVRKPRPEEIP